MVIFAGITGGAILEVMKNAPEIDADAVSYTHLTLPTILLV